MQLVKIQIFIGILFLLSKDVFFVETGDVKVEVITRLDTEAETVEVLTVGSCVEKSGGRLGVVCLVGRSAVEDGGGLEVDMGGGPVVLFIGGSSLGDLGGGPCCKVWRYITV